MVKYFSFAILCLSFSLLHAASFDCKKAKTLIEAGICFDPELSLLDEKLSNVYKESLKKNSSLQLKQIQLKWILEERDICKDIECLKDSYNKRLSVLTNNEDVVASIKGSKDEAKYFRYYNDKKDEHTSIVFKPATNGMVNLSGISVNSGGRIAEFSGDAKIIKNSISFEDGECKIKIERRTGEDFSLKEQVGSSCGGLGVTFDGDYRKE